MSGLDENASEPCIEERLPIRRKKKNKKRNRRWQSDLDAVEIGPFLFVPLTCTKDLKDEGHAMEHCVATFSDFCRGDWLRVFSVRDILGQRRLATLSLIHEHDHWCLDQIKGIRNTDVINQEQIYFDGDRLVTDLVLTDLYYAGMEFVEIYRQASDHKCRQGHLQADFRQLTAILQPFNSTD